MAHHKQARRKQLAKGKEIYILDQNKILFYLQAVQFSFCFTLSPVKTVHSHGFPSQVAHFIEAHEPKQKDINACHSEWNINLQVLSEIPKELLI